MSQAGVSGEVSTVCIIQARLGSTRLPRKVLMDVGGRPLIEHVVVRARAIVGVDRVVIACPYGEGVVFGEYAEVIEGPVEDVLRRYYLAALRTLGKTIVRVTGDCPLLDPSLSTRVLRSYRELGADFADNVDPKADGTDTEVFSHELLIRAHLNAILPTDREHVTPWMRRHATRSIHVQPHHLPCKLSVDTQADLDAVRAVMLTPVA